MRELAYMFGGFLLGTFGGVVVAALLVWLGMPDIYARGVFNGVIAFTCFYAGCMYARKDKAA